MAWQNSGGPESAVLDMQGEEDHIFRERIWCNLTTVNNESVLIGVVYNSGSSSRENTNALFKLMRSEVFNKFDRVFIYGDFNFSNATWDGKLSTEKDEEVYEAIRDGFFTQHITNKIQRQTAK